jgi:pyruvate dehydrogenase (quinone)
MSRTVADQLADVLAVAGVRRIHGTAGDDLHWLVHAIRRRGRIHWLPVQHADVAAYAACNEARSTDELAVCAGSCGAGDPRLADALFDCHRSRARVLAIAGFAPSAEIGGAYRQEALLQDQFGDCSHYCKLVSDPRQMPRLLDIAIREAVGKHGVSVLALPGEIALEPASDASPRRVAGRLPAPPAVTPPQGHPEHWTPPKGGIPPISDSSHR